MPEGTRALHREPAGLTAQLARWAAETRYDELPPEAIEAGRQLALDTLASAWAGAELDGLDAVADLLTERGGRPESTLWRRGGRLPAPAAALLNGMAAAALDYDSVHDRATIHSDIVVLPAALAVGEAVGASGGEVLAATIIGNELAIRLALAVRSSPGWYYTAVLGVFGATAAAGRLVGLDAAGMNHAFGIALGLAAGSQQSLVERSLTKRLQSASAAQAGVEAALLAQRGITGPAEVFEGRCGFQALYTELDEEAIFDRLGTVFHMTQLTFKRYPSCFCNFAAIEAALALARQHAFDPEEMADIEVSISPFMDRLVGAPFSPGAMPQVAAQFSVQYSIASALLRHRFEIADIERVAVLDNRILPLAGRVRVRVDPANPGKFAPATVTVTDKAGRSYSACIDSLPGTPDRPLTREQRLVKARQCFAYGGLHDRAAETLIGRIDRLDHLEDIEDLLAGTA